MENIGLTKSKVLRLLGKVSSHEMGATSIKRMRYWQAHYDRLNKLARKVGWLG